MEVISFRLLGVPVAVRPSFWLVAALLGWGGVRSAGLLAAWIGIVFVSVLAHEFGHALLARRFGADVSITLTTFGGYTRWQMSGEGMTPGRRGLVAGAGSAVGIAFGLAIWGGFYVTRPWGPVAADVASMLVWVNLGWGVLNWLPIRPLDGGHLVMATLDIIAPRRADQIASVIFLVTSVGAAIVAFYFDLLFAAILAAVMAWSEISRYLGPRSDPLPLEFSYDDPDGGSRQDR